MNLLSVPVDVPRLPSVLIYGRAVSRCGVNAPSRSRTENLMIKSHGVSPASQIVRASDTIKLVPRRCTDSATDIHTTFVYGVGL